ncbi:MAG: hypothetical protein IKS69_03280 [Erysipelotrichaceae bacterium]|nr:hypothetical protein [Erysipelotrichaceae bacterium]
MDILKIFYISLYVILSVVLVCVLLKLLAALKKMTIEVEGVSESIENVSDNVASLENKLAVIRNTADSWKFFAALYIVLRIIRETLRYRKKDGLSRSFSKACVRNVRNLSSIKL